MEQHKLRTYSLYAIGEIALVMIGILLALQVNNWNEERQMINSANDHQEILLKNLKDDHSNLTEIIEELEISLKSSVNLVERFKKNLPPEKDEIIFEVTQLIFEYNFRPDKSGLEILVNSSELAVLSDSLRNEISQYYKAVEYIQERDEISNSFIKSQYEVVVLDEYGYFWTKQNPHPALSIYNDDQRYIEPIDPLKVLKDKKLETLVFARNFQTEKQLLAYEDGIEKLNKLIGSLEGR